MDASMVGAAHVAEGKKYVGRGVDIFREKYLEPANKSRIVKEDAPVDTIPLGRTELHETYGKNFAEFVQKFAVSAGVEGSYMGFSASVEAKYATSSRQNIDIQFAELSLISSGAIVSLSSDPAALRPFLDPNFKNALETADPKELFTAYGTHLAVKVKIGGIISYYSNSKATEHQSESEFKLAARFKYEGFGAAVGANGELTTEQKELAKTVEGSLNLFVSGGSDSTRIAVEHGKKDSYVAWAGTLGTHPGFSGFMEDGLLPVWLLTDDTEKGKERRKALELAFRQEAARLFQIRIFMHTGEVSPGPEARISIPPYYKLLAGGARDNWNGAGNLLTASYPLDKGTWLARGKDHWQSSPASMTVWAMAIYDNLKPNLWEVKQVSATGSASPHPSAEVALPQDFIDKGGVLVGGGAQASRSQLLTSSYPKNATTWAANATEPVDTSPATVTVHVDQEPSFGKVLGRARYYINRRRRLGGLRGGSR
jgi:hypothetical protein